MLHKNLCTGLYNKRNVNLAEWLLPKVPVSEPFSAQLNT